ncbi:neurturin-like [Pristis pectinata]|uniref:neurturin-like n=1 Tax=Pristis pectinata TaxID=685728 RepID=UPI00223DFE54|nr:neurturin-like [Pristis pectinata]
MGLMQIDLNPKHQLIISSHHCTIVTTLAGTNPDIQALKWFGDLEDSASSHCPVGARGSGNKNMFKTHTDEEARELVRALIQRYRRSPDWRRKTRTHSRPALRSKRAKSRATKGCTLKEINVTVSDLGISQISEEVVRFRYCTGSCDAEKKFYDLTLKNLRNSKLIKKEVRARPCCRPTLYDDDVSFLDVNFRYHTLRQLSAKECGCV